uniref:N-lysine methyltransferase SETD6 n=1 Tax=Latimeria chalumnae TaxID=7897 RepID=H3AWK3_LATCH
MASIAKRAKANAQNEFCYPCPPQVIMAILPLPSYSNAARNPADEVLSAFLDWCEKVDVKLSSKVYISKEGTVSGYGMLAREDIDEGEVLFSVPRKVLLNHETTSIHTLLEKENLSLQSPSGWVPLLMSLLYEYTNEKSHWKPYFSLWMDFKGLEHPMFWSEQERAKLLQGTGIPEAVATDLINIQKEYNTIVLPFMKSHPTLFDPKKHTLELYKKLVAFVMAYSFQDPPEDEDDEDDKDPNPPMMVPMADILNHVANHNANLEFTPECLKMVSVRKISQGEEVFNTYGQMANWQLLHMYGFVEPYPGNINEAADIQMSTMHKAAVLGTKSEAERKFVTEKWDLLCKLEMVGEEGAFVIGLTEVLTEEELFTTLKVLTMSAEEFEDYKENEDWEEVEDDEEVSSMTDEIHKLKLPWKQLLHSSAELTLASYKTDLKADEHLITNPEAYSKLSQREQTSLQVRYGQKKILHQLLDLTK